LVTLAAVPDNTPVILCTIADATSAPDDDRAMEWGEFAAVADYLVKPIAEETLLAVVRDSLRRRGLNPDGPATILLVDDEPDELRLFWRMLAATGHPYRVLTAANGVEALEVLREHRPDLIVSDLLMPEMNGFQLVAAKNAIAEVRDIPLVIISARDPQGHPIVAESITAIRAGGLSIPQLLACIEGLSGILSPLPRVAE
jgi:CheY-like chemotaxis protein